MTTSERATIQHGVRVPHYDGVRGIAIALVVVSHTLSGVFPSYRAMVSSAPAWILGGGGYTGVQLFFVLSGFLITSLLVGERSRRGRVDLRAFYGRRARRLLPALGGISIVYLVASEALYDGPRLERARNSVVRALTFTANFPDTVLASDEWLGHTWSLAVEEQFYLVWPLLIVLLTRREPWRRAVFAASTGAVLVTVALRATGRFAPSVVYELLRWDAIAAGCLVAVVAWRPRWWLVVASSATVAGTTLYYPDYPPWWSYAVVAGACAVLVAGAPSVPWLAWPPLCHLGRISYSLYLWHVLIYRLGPPWFVGLPAALLVSEASYRWIERPFLRPHADAVSTAKMGA